MTGPMSFIGAPQPPDSETGKGNGRNPRETVPYPRIKAPAMLLILVWFQETGKGGGRVDETMLTPFGNETPPREGETGSGNGKTR
jgi:hypothetical protein